LAAAAATANVAAANTVKNPETAPFRVRCQDRDELARLFTLENAGQNGVSLCGDTGDNGQNSHGITGQGGPNGPNQGGHSEPNQSSRIIFSAHTEALLSGEPGESFDLILSNVPAKAGTPVLEDFTGRSLGLLAPGGRAIIVVVNTLADFFRAAIGGEEFARLVREEVGAEHTVFVYALAGRAAQGMDYAARHAAGQAVYNAGAGAKVPAGASARTTKSAVPETAALAGGAMPGPAVREEAQAEKFSPGGRPCFLQAFPFYQRSSACHEMEGLGYHIDAVHGAAEFDSPGMAAEAAAKLLRRLGPAKLFAAGTMQEPGAAVPPAAPQTSPTKPASAILFHEGGQGHFPVWFLKYREQNGIAGPEILVLHGRNILALEAAKHNIIANSITVDSITVGNTNGIKITHDGNIERQNVRIVPGVDVGLDRERLRAELAATPFPAVAATAERPPQEGIAPGDIAPPQGIAPRGYDFIAAFPQSVPQTDRCDSMWEGLGALLLPGGVAILGFPSTAADRFDRRKPSGFARLGDLKWQGFRALTYRR
jgi:hypothetical protein